MNPSDKILILGSNGLVGSSLVRLLRSQGYNNLITPSRKDVDLIIQDDVLSLFMKHQPDYVFLAAAKVGGIMANMKSPADFIYQNLMIQTNVLHIASIIKSAKKILFLGSSCIYPKYAEQPLKEEYLLSGQLEESNKPYAVAKIAGLVMAKAYHDQLGQNVVCVMPSNLYGPGDNFDPDSSHVLPALIMKFHKAKLENQPVTLWGSGSPRRELLHVDDLSHACLQLMNSDYNDPNPINVGFGSDYSIIELANMVREIVGYKGEIIWDTTKPDGTPRKLLDTTKISQFGWKPQIKLEDGVKATYQWYLDNY